MQKSLQYGSVVTPWTESVVTGSEIPTEESLRDVSDSKPLSVEPMAQISKETKLQVGGVVGVALLIQKVRIGGHDAGQGLFVHREREGRGCKELGEDVFSFCLKSLGETKKT